MAKGDRLPPLITASPPGTPRDQAGVLGAPGTTVLFGDDRVNDEMRLGYRIRAGLWLDCDQTCGIEGDIFFLDPTGDGASFSSTGSPILGRPFLNANGAPDAQLVAFPGVIAGTVTASNDSTAWGATVNARHRLCCGCNYRVDALLGYRFLGLSDTLTVGENLVATDPEGDIEAGTRFQIQDRFRTTNAFHGGQLGLKGEHWRGRAFLGWNVSVALGNVHQSIDIGGSTRIANPGQTLAVLPGGLLALQSNSGQFDRDDFAVLPAAGVSAGVRLTERLHVFAGYDFMYLSHVTRPGDVIDLTVNPALLPPPVGGGPARPAVLGGSSDYWLHGVSAGVEWRF
jgi:hypothetical protein